MCTHFHIDWDVQSKLCALISAVRAFFIVRSDFTGFECMPGFRIKSTSDILTTVPNLDPNTV